MRVKMILPALTEAVSPFWRPIKYSLFPPLGLATLAGYLPDGWEVELQDEHVEQLRSVSYTHLDVYKRQSMLCTQEASGPRLLSSRI